MNQNQQSILDKSFKIGSHFLSLSKISRGGTIENLSFLHSGFQGILSFEHENLVLPTVKIKPQDGNKKWVTVDFHSSLHYYIKGNIIVFESTTEYGIVSFKIAPLEYDKGAIGRIEVFSNENVEVSMELSVSTDKLYKTVIDKTELCCNVVQEKTKEGFLLVQAKTIDSICGFGVAFEKDFDSSSKNTLKKVFKAKKQTQIAEHFFIAVGCSSLDISFCLKNLIREGGDNLFKLQTEILQRREIFFDSKMQNVLNVNLNYCYYHTIGRTVDKDELVLMTSTDPLSKVAVFDAREIFLFSFPCILRADKNVARKVLDLGLKKYHECFKYELSSISGQPLSKAFSLDALIAPIIALKSYVEFTSDKSILEENNIKEHIEFTFSILNQFKSKNGLFATEVNSSDTLKYQFVTHSNCLVAVALKFLNDSYGDELLDIILKRCTLFVDDKKVICHQTDNGNFYIKQNSLSELGLLPHFNLFDKDDPIMTNTLNLYKDKLLLKEVNDINTTDVFDRLFKILSFSPTQSDVEFFNLIKTETVLDKNNNAEKYAPLCGFIAFAICYLNFL